MASLVGNFDGPKLISLALFFERLTRSTDQELHDVLDLVGAQGAYAALWCEGGVRIDACICIAHTGILSGNPHLAVFHSCCKSPLPQP